MKITLSLLVLLLGAPVLAVPVSVSVVDDKGAPVAGADVQLESFAKAPKGIVSTSTNGAGVAAFEVEPSAMYPDFVGRIAVWKNDFALGGGSLSIKKPLRVVLQPSNSVSGTVTDEEKRPIAGATVSFSYYRTNGENGFRSAVYLFEGPLKDKMQTVSGKDGTWKLDHVPPDVLVSVSIRAAGRANGEGQLQSGASLQSVLRPGAQIDGRLLGLDGKPLAGVRVTASSQSRDNDESRSFDREKTAADGTFHLSGLKKGLYTVGFAPDTDAPFTVASVRDVAASPEKAVQLPDARAVQGTLIGGQIVASDTKTPVAGVYVMLQSDENPDSMNEAITDDTGHWKMRTLEKGGKLAMQNAPQGFVSDRTQRAVTITGDNTNLDFKLARAPKITGRLVDENGKGIQTSSLVLRQKYDEFPLQSDENGNFTAFGPKDGTIEIGRPRWSGAEEGDGPKWDVVGTNKFPVVSAHPLEIHLKAAQLSSLELGVFDQKDVAVEGAKVMLLLWSGEGNERQGESRELISDKTGRIHVGDIRADQTVSIQSATKDGFDAAPLPKVEKQNGVFRADIQLTRRDGKASGQVFDAGGAPLANAAVFGSGVETTSDAAGRFSLAPLPSGKTDIIAWSGNGFALGSSDQTRLDLKQQTLEPTDRNRAEAVLAALREQTKNTKYWRRDSLSLPATGADFDTLAAKTLASGNLRDYYALATQFGTDASITPDKWLPLFGAMKSPTDRLDAVMMWNAKAPSVGPGEASRALLSSLENDVATVEKSGDASNWQNAIGIFGAAAVAERLGQSERADALFERGQVFVLKHFPEKGGTNGNNPSQDDTFAVMGGVTAVSPRFLSKMVALVDADSPAYSRLLQEGAPAVARRSGLDAARPFLDQLKAAPAPKPDADGRILSIPLARTVIKSIIAGGKSNPKLALELAQSLPKGEQSMGEDGRDGALCEAAFFQSPEVAQGLWRESLPRLEASAAMRFIARIAQADEPLARGFYEDTRQRFDSMTDNPNALMYGRQGQVAAFAFYEARFAPARARARLETGFVKAQNATDGRYFLESYVRAMAVFDADRASQWADKIGTDENDFTGFEAKRSIALWLALDAARRQKTNFNDRYGNEDNSF